MWSRLLSLLGNEQFPIAQPFLNALTASAAVFSLCNISYYIPSPSVDPTQLGLVQTTTIAEPGPLGYFAPATVFWFNDVSSITPKALQGLRHQYQVDDDVFCPHFLDNVFFALPRQESGLDLSKPAKSVLSSWNTKSYSFLDLQSSEILPPGPYFTNPEGIRQAWRIYPDLQNAFMIPSFPVEDNKLRFQIPLVSGVPVPSRLYSSKASSDKPLAGKRFALKDIFDIEGLPTSAGSRAYSALHPQAGRTAPCIEELINLGAIILGTTKTVQFVSAMPASAWIDYQCPFNPRGDGYQAPSSSSAGSAAALASYPWLDITVGSDTIGSVRFPAAVQGLFGLRPTWGMRTMEGVFNQSRPLDTIGLFARDIELLANVTEVWLSKQRKSNSDLQLAQIIWPTDIAQPETKAFQEAVNWFLTLLEDFAGFGKTSINLNQIWSQYNPTKDSLEKHLDRTLGDIHVHDNYHNLESFRKAYHQQFGKKPYVEPYIQAKWDMGANVSSDRYHTATKEMQDFANFFTAKVLPERTDEGLYSVLVMPAMGTEAPVYRDMNLGPPEEGAKRFQGYGFSSWSISTLAGVPSITVPISQYEYVSNVTGEVEKLPICVSVLGSKGGENQVLRLMSEFLKSSAELHSNVQTGHSAFPI